MSSTSSPTPTSPIADSGARGTFNNAGLLKKTGGSDTTSVDMTLNNTATDADKDVEVQSGRLAFIFGGTSTGRFEAEGAGDVLAFAGGTHDLNTTSNLFGAGEIQFSGGTTNFNAGTYNPSGLTNVNGGTANFNSAASTGSFTMTAGIQGGTNTLTVAGTTTWTGGMFNGGGGTVLNGTTTVSGVGTKDLSARTIINNATLNFSAPIRVYDSGIITNAVTGVFDIQTDDDVSFCCSGSRGTFNNAGLLKKTAGAGTSIFDMSLGNTADDPLGIVVQSGTLAFPNGGTSWGRFAPQAGSIFEFSGGTHTLTKDPDVLGQGIVRFSGGTTNLQDGIYNVTGTTEVTGGTINFNSAASTGRFAMSSGTQGGLDTLTVTGGPNTWTGGMFAGSGQTLLSGGTTTTISTTNTKDISARTITNNGSIDWTAGDVRVYDAGVINNAATGDIDIQSDADITFCCSGSKGTFNNMGTLRKTGGALGATGLDLNFNNASTGSIELRSTSTGNDKLAIGAPATLDGTLVMNDTGFSPADGQTFEVMTYPSHTGCFSSVVDNGGLPAGFIYVIECNATNVVVTAFAPDERSVSLTSNKSQVKFGGPFTLSGTVTSDESACEDTVEVDIMRKVGGTANFVLVETVTTDSGGDFELPQTGDKNALYRANLDQVGLCEAGQSATKSIVVKLKVALSATPKKVKKGKEVSLTATVTPCGDHAGLQAKLFRRVKRTDKRGFLLQKKNLNNQCKVTFTKAIKIPTQFKVQIVPGPDHQDHPNSVSAWVPVGIRP